MKKANIIINSDKLIDNYNYYKNNNEIVICIVKSNSYGCGITRIVKLLLSIGVKHFAVFTIHEAKIIRKISNDCFILILNSIEKKDLDEIYYLNLTISINSIEDYFLIKNSKINIPVHLKIDTGMHRFGLSPDEFRYVINDGELCVTGIFSHLVGGINSYDYISKQIDTFDNLLKDLDLSKYLIHICSSSSAKIIKSKYQNAIRIGLGLYGFSTYLNPCVSINLPIVLKKKIFKDDYCSYDCSFKAPSDGYIYIIPLGYHNWVLPNFILNIKGFVNAGKICMNCLSLFSVNDYKEKAITLNGYDLIKIANDNNVSIYWLLSSFTS